MLFTTKTLVIPDQDRGTPIQRAQQGIVGGVNAADRDDRHRVPGERRSVGAKVAKDRGRVGADPHPKRERAQEQGPVLREGGHHGQRHGQPDAGRDDPVEGLAHRHAGLRLHDDADADPGTGGRLELDREADKIGQQQGRGHADGERHRVRHEAGQGQQRPDLGSRGLTHGLGLRAEPARCKSPEPELATAQPDGVPAT